MVGNLGELVLEVANVGLEIVTLFNFDREEVVILLSLPARGILGEKSLDYLFETFRTNATVESRTNPRPCLSGRKEKLDTRADHCGNRPSSCL